MEKTVTDGEIKKAYRKLSLLTHPDKNGYEGADEAFKSESLLHRLKHKDWGYTVFSKGNAYSYW